MNNTTAFVETRTLQCFFVTETDGRVAVIYRKRSQPEQIFMVEACHDDPVVCFLNAIGEVPGLLPVEVIKIASKLSILLPPLVLGNLIRTQGMINQIARKWKV